jgi:hypothetical protein
MPNVPRVSSIQLFITENRITPIPIVQMMK